MVILVNEEIVTLAENIAHMKSPDTIICASAWKFSQSVDVIFETYDINCGLIAEKIFNLNVIWSFDNNEDVYTGYKHITANHPYLSSLYSHPEINVLNCIENQYVLVKNENDTIADYFIWKDGAYQRLNRYGISFKSKMFGEIKPLDIYQSCAFDSISNNDITVLFGRSGSGKTTIPLSYILSGLENGKIGRCYIIYHFEPLKGAKTLGFEKGSHQDKILNTASIGNILSSKMGDISVVEALITEGKIEIVPTANIRGMEISSNDVVYITEAQDLNTYTLKTIIQRCKTGCKQIYEGDILEQSDLKSNDIGLIKMINIFKGYKEFGCVKLKENYRGELGKLADLM